jgi:phage tail sheath gpL-like
VSISITFEFGGIRIAGSEQSETATTPAKPGKVALTVSGSVGTPFTGTRHVVLTVGGFRANATYDETATAHALATALAAAANVSSSPVTAAVSGDIVMLTSKTAGTAGNLAYAVVDSRDFGVAPRTGSLTGGTNAVTTTKYDGGSVDVAVGSVRASSTWGKTSTPHSIAGALATSLNAAANGTFTASVKGDTVVITPSSNTRSTPTVTVDVNDAKGFTPASFTATSLN